MASADFRINGNAVGTPAVVAAAGTVTATLDSTDGVRQVQWYLASTDETALPANYTLVQSGSVGQTVTTTALGLGTAAILRAKINGGVNLSTGLNDPTGTEATGKFYVLTAGGYAVGCVNEIVEHNGVFGWAAIVNPIIRAIPSAVVTSVGVTSPILNTGSATAPVIALDYTLAGTANKVPIRGASSEIYATTFRSGATASYGAANVTLESAATSSILKATPGAGPGQDIVIRAATGGDAGSVGGNLTIGPGIGGTADVVAGGSMTFAMQSDGSASGSLIMTGGTLGTFLTIGYDNATTTLTFVTTKNTLRLNAATTIDFQINGTTEATVTASGINVVSGNTYAVNGVGHATAATASSLPFRGASGEASFAYIYPAGTVSASGMIRLPKTATAITFRDSGDSVDIDALSMAGDDIVHLAKTNALGASIMGEINVASNAIGFYGVAAQAQPSVTGSRGGNAALASLLTALDTLGLIVDNTSA